MNSTYGPTIRIGDHDCPLRDTWIHIMDLADDEANDGPKELNAIQRIVPPHFVAINSESAQAWDPESRLWELLFKKFGTKLTHIQCWKGGGIYLSPVRISDDVYCIGDITWAVFVNPWFLIELIKESRLANLCKECGKLK